MYAQHPDGTWLYRGPDGRRYYHRVGMLGWAPYAAPPAVGVGNIFDDVAKAVTSPFKAAGQVVNDALGGTFVGSAVRAAGRTAQTGLDAISKATKSVGDAIERVPVVGGPLSAVYDVATDPLTLPLTVADDVVHGDSVGQTVTDSIRHEVAKFKAAAPYVESVVALVPGVGGMCASAIAVGVGVAEGQPIDQILVEAAAAQVPGGAIVVAGYLAAKTVLSGKTRPIAWDTVAVGALQGISAAAGTPLPPGATSALASAAKFGSDVANGKTVKEAGLDALVAAIPTTTTDGKALHAAVTVALAETEKSLQGSRVGDALFGYGIKQVPAAQQQQVQKGLTTAIGLTHASNLQAAKTQAAPGLLAKLEVVGASDVTPVVAAARAALGGVGVDGFNAGHGLMQYAGDLYQTTALRAQLGDAADQSGFDTALALKVGNVASTLPAGVAPPVAAGYLVGAGSQTASEAQKDAIRGTVAGDPAVVAGVDLRHGQVTPLEYAALGVLAAGTVLLVAGIVARG
jgi:hypothetical protein